MEEQDVEGDEVGRRLEIRVGGIEGDKRERGNRREAWKDDKKEENEER